MSKSHNGEGGGMAGDFDMSTPSRTKTYLCPAGGFFWIVLSYSKKTWKSGKRRTLRVENLRSV
jgi:hypothetical protein